MLRFPMYINETMMKEDLEALDLSVRSNNCLRRVGFHTIGGLVEGINGWEELSRIRNCGKSSYSEILMKLFFYQYMKLSKDRQARYMKRVQELNETDFL